ncbi:MAG: uroporphyrinogen-III synthase [Sulfuricellaceae bacterium]|nr:uroporphyrinogen-III synthase [Sulfuricellaceae bacterium]
MGKPLAGIGVLVTRPETQARNLSELIVQAGGTPVAFPALEIRAPADPSALQHSLGQLASFDWLIFISPTAVEQSLAWLGGAAALSAGPRLAAVGKGTLRALARHGIANAIAPEGGADSEALLDMAPLRQVEAQRILIVRGEGGREWLAETLRQRGAEVSYAECYRRVRPDADPAALLERWARGEIAAVTVTSSESLDNLYAMLGANGRVLLESTPMFAIHPRIADEAGARGVKQVVVAGPSDEALLQGLIDWFKDER